MSIPDLLSAIKLLCMRFQRELVAVVDDLRLDTLLRMLKTPHFSTKMNSLKEVSYRGLGKNAKARSFQCAPHLTARVLVWQVTKLIEESTVSKTVKNAIDTDKLLDWLVENSVLSIALEGKAAHQDVLLKRRVKNNRSTVHDVPVFQATLTRLSTVKGLRESLSCWGVNCRWTSSLRSGKYRSETKHWQ